MKFFNNLVVALVIVWFFASSSSAVMFDVSIPLRIIEIDSKDGLETANLYAIPLTIKRDGNREENGRLMVVSVPRKRLYWWRYEMGRYPKNSTFPADQFLQTCKPYLDENALLIFCATSKWLLVGRSDRTYESDSELGSLVKAEFDKNSSNFRTGLDYFEKRINLREIIEQRFFAEPGSARSVQIHFGDIGKKNNQYEITLIGAKQSYEDESLPMVMKLLFTPDFNFIRSSSSHEPDNRNP